MSVIMTDVTLFVTGWLLGTLLAQSPQALSQEGAAAMRAGRFAEAERAYRALRQADAANAMWRMNLGLALHSQAKFAEAAAELDAFVKARPAPGPAHLLLGTARLKLKQGCDAVPPLEKARVWNPAMAAVELADAYFGCGQFLKAAQAYEALPQRTPAVTRQAAHCYWRARDYAQAKRLFALAPGDDPAFQYEYGDTLVRAEGAAAGLPWLEKAVRANPELVEARGELGKALLAVGRAEEAIGHLEKAAERDTALLLPLSNALRRVGRTEEAGRALARYKAR